MKTTKLLAVLVVLTAGGFACSEGSYVQVPATTTTGVTNPYVTNTGYTNGYTSPYTTPYGTQNGYGNTIVPGTQFFNPYLANTNNYYASLGSSGMYQLGTAAPNMFSCAARATPNYYMFLSEFGTCAVRRQLTYSPTSCACTQAPCDCNSMLTAVRDQCTNSSGEFTAVPNYAKTTSVNTASVIKGVDENSRVLPLTILGQDARALYRRLQKQGDVMANSTSSNVITGSGYKCMMDGKGKTRSDYACDLDVAVADGSVYQQYPVSGNGPALENAAPFNGSNVQVGVNGLATNEGYILLDGKVASFLYRKMTAQESQGTMMRTSNQNVTTTYTAKMKTGKNVKCYQPMDNSGSTECRVHINTITGEVMNAS